MRISRIRAGGVVASRLRLATDAASPVERKKLRISGLPNRKGANLKKRGV
jgi:hypothetical protein